MSDDPAATSKDGPARAGTAFEVQGLFSNDAAMQEAIGQLTRAGFDRAELSLPVAQLDPAHATPETSAEVPTTPIDVQQTRTMATSMAGTIGAFAAAGAIIATGGAAALAIAGAAAVGGGAAAVVHTAGDGIAANEQQRLDDRAAAGELVLAVRTITADKRDIAMRIMRDCGASRVGDVARTTAELGAAEQDGVDSTGWTG